MAFRRFGPHALLRIQSAEMSKKKPASQASANPALTTIKPVVWLSPSKTDAQTLRKSLPTQLRSALEKLVFIRCGLHLKSDDCHLYPAPNGGKARAIITGKGGGCLRIVFAEHKDKTIYILRVFHKQNNRLTTADVSAIATQWAAFKKLS